MRGRKHIQGFHTALVGDFIKKESPNEGTETRWSRGSVSIDAWRQIKKESPNEGTETPTALSTVIKNWLANKKRIPEWGDGNFSPCLSHMAVASSIKKESPNEGTETFSARPFTTPAPAHKKRIPEWGDGNPVTLTPAMASSYSSWIKKESPNEGTETLSTLLKV